jgi:hypothetical protein
MSTLTRKHFIDRNTNDAIPLAELRGRVPQAHLRALRQADLDASRASASSTPPSPPSTPSTKTAP